MHSAHLIKERGCGDLSMVTLHVKYPFVLFGSESSALTLPLFLLSLRIIMLRLCSRLISIENRYSTNCPSTMTKDHFWLNVMALNGFCADVPLSNHSFICNHLSLLLKEGPSRSPVRTWSKNFDWDS